MKNPVKTFAANTEGRDFVIGDLHGSYRLFEDLLKHLNFDRTKDRMFSVGDLVDRGPQSLECLSLLYEPWFHAVLSNHEQMMLEAFYGGYMGQFWLRNGGFWGAEALNTWRNNRQPKVNGVSHARPPTDDEQRLFDLLEKVAELPFLITVGRRDGTKVHVIHAELPPGIHITDADLADPTRLVELATVQSHDGDFIVWGRHIFYNFYRANLSNVDKVKRAVAYNFGRKHHFGPHLSHIVSGHTIVQRPITVMGQTNIDTGAWESLHSGSSEWSALTCLDLNDWVFYQARPDGVRRVDSLVVSLEDVSSLLEVVRPSAVNSGSAGGSDGEAQPP